MFASISLTHFAVQQNTIKVLFESISPGFPGGSDDKESACNAGDPGSIPGFGRSPAERHGYALQYSCLENPRDRGYSPWGHKEVDTAEEKTLPLPLLRLDFATRRQRSF